MIAVYKQIANKVHSELKTNKQKIFQEGFMFAWEERKLKRQSSLFPLRIVG